MVTFAAASGCSLFGYDHTDRIVERTLLDERGSLDEAAYSAALSAKFPVGSPAASLRQYVEANGGTCHEDEPQVLWCNVPVSGQFCVVSSIGIRADTDHGTISALSSQLTQDTC